MAGSSFRFELAPVLQLRERAVELAQEALGRAIRHRKDRENRVRAVTDTLNASLDVDTAPQTVSQLGGAAAHREVLARSLSDALRDLERSQASEEAARRQLGKAMRDHEALKTLRTEAADVHRTEALRSEATRLDDLIISRARPVHPASAASPRV
ncbi:MAG: hypothetical protein Rubg2KO_36800 [Rubricoccaceae bacterium]